VPFRQGRTYLPNTNHLVGQVEGRWTQDWVYGASALQSRDHSTAWAATAYRCRSWRREQWFAFSYRCKSLGMGFAHFTRRNVIESGQPIGSEVRVEQGSSSTLQPIAASGASLLVPKDAATDVSLVPQLPSIISAPIARDQVLGQIEVRSKTNTVAVVPAVSPSDIPRAHWAIARH
jgi:hypothetical protein